MRKRKSLLEKNNFYMSYSQFTDLSCPLKWKLKRIDLLDSFTPNEFNVYGTALHETSQEYVNLAFKKSKKFADKLNLENYFNKRLFETYKKEKENINENFLNKEKIEELIEDSIQNIKDFKSKFFNYFPISEYELVGIEKVINCKIKNKENLRFFGKADLILKNKKTGIYTILDLKTTYRGWNKKKINKNKLQLLLYKYYYAKQHNIDLDKIDVMYIFIKRKVFQNKDLDFTISSVSKSSPSNKRCMDKYIDNFIETLDKFYNISEESNKVKLRKTDNFKSVKSDENCKYCPFKKTKYCDEWK